MNWETWQIIVAVSVGIGLLLGLGEIIGRWKFNKMCQDLQSRKRHIHLKAVRDLRKSRNPRALGPLTEYLKRWQESNTDYGDAVHAVGEIGGLEAVMPLLTDEWPDGVVSYAAFFVGKCGDPQTVEPLIKLLRHHSHGVRGSAADALANIGDVRAIPPLLKLYDSLAPVEKHSGGVKVTSYNAADYSLSTTVWLALRKLGYNPPGT